MYAVHLSPKAAADVRAAYNWYLKETQNLADDFLDEMQAYVDKIAANPDHFSPVPKRNARFAILKRFPYKIYFQVNDITRRADIVAVVHKARRPQFWKRRL